MIRREGGEQICECDLCGAEEYSGTLGFTEFIRRLHQDGWESHWEGDEWNHRCPDCRE
jgi:hypothetical protein